jgi:hypothetical protein
MTTSFNNPRLIEKYIEGKLDAQSKQAFEASLMTNPLLRNNLYFQKKVHFLVKMYHRKKLKEELETMHQRIFSDPDKIVFQQNIYRLFK